MAALVRAPFPIVLKFLIRSRTVNSPRIPDGRRVYAVGDVHGCADQFGRLMAAIRADHVAREPAEPTLVLLGDLVDRGPDTRAVVEHAMGLRSDWDLTLLKGNHEEILLRAAEGDRVSLQLFDRVGGRATLLSYGVSGDRYDDATLDELSRLIVDAIPAAHRAFLDAGEDQRVIGDYAFVHAGIRPGLPLAEQRAADLRWIREPFLSYRGQHERLIVHGHTIVAAPDVQSNRIGIDTGAYADGRLTAIGLEGQERWFLTA